MTAANEGGVSVAKMCVLVAQNLRRNKSNLLLSSVGILVGISTFVFFVALGQGIKTVVLEEVFVIQQLEVVPRTFDVGAFQTEGLFGGPKLDDRTVERLRKLEGVRGVYPKMKFAFPAQAWGGREILGKNFYTELIADGVPPELVQSELDDPSLFRDFDAGTIACNSGDACPAGRTCEDGECVKRSCTPPEVDRRGRPVGDDDCPGISHCGLDTRKCETPIPALLHPRLLEIYNGSVHTALQGSAGSASKVPRLSRDALLGLQVWGTLGRSYLGRAAKGKAVTRRFVLVGFSNKAIGLGATVPIGYVRRWNARFKGEDAANEYHSILVETASNDAVPGVARAITEKLGFALDSGHEDAQRAGLVISIVTGVFTLISAVIVFIAAVNIMHTFLMVIVERRREIGIMRALGATKTAIRLMIMIEAGALGLVGGIVGCLLGVLFALGVDRAFQTATPAFPFKPETLFAWEPWFFVVGIAGAVLFCLLGAAMPALRASNMDPAAVLTGQ
jgi:ABC-type antimicrobial peptide transport system permease subunit